MKFPHGTAEDLIKLIVEHPLAWLVSTGGSGFEATPLPLLPELDAEGNLVALLGHCSRANRQVQDLRENPAAHVLFSGPQGYISPTIVHQPRWIPTWNYAVAAIAVDIEFVEEETLSSVEQLTDAAEAAHGSDWTIAEAGDRVEGMIHRIVAFRAHVRAVDARFKLGQDESATTVSDIIDGLRDPNLRGWIHRMNADRLADEPHPLADPALDNQDISQ